MILFTLDSNPAARTCTLGQQRSRRGGTTAHSTIRNITIDAYLEHPRRTTYPNRGITAWPTHLAARPSARFMWNASCHALPTPASHGLAGLGPTCPGLGQGLAGLAGLAGWACWAACWPWLGLAARARLKGGVVKEASHCQCFGRTTAGARPPDPLIPSGAGCAGCWPVPTTGARPLLFQGRRLLEVPRNRSLVRSADCW